MGNLVFQATLGGQVNLVGPNTASTFNLNVPAVSSTIATTSGTETLTNKTLTTPVINGFTGDTSVVNIGSGQLYKDTSGNVGVGTSSPSYKLDVSGTGRISSMTFTPDGSYSAPYQTIGFSGNNNGKTRIFGTTNDSDNLYLAAGTGRGVTIWTNGSTANVATFDTAGNLGLGVTPSTWSTGKNFQFAGGNVISSAASNDFEIGQNFYYNAGYKYFGTGYASNFVQYNGQFQWLTAGSGTAGNAITFTQAMTLDANGTLLVGTTSGNSNFKSITYNANTYYSLGLKGDTYGLRFVGTSSAYRIEGVDNSLLASYNPVIVGAGGYIAFETGSAGGGSLSERARITSSGQVFVGLTSSINGNCTYQQSTQCDGNQVQVLRNTSSSTPYIAYWDYSGVTPNNAGSYFLQCNDPTANRFQLRSNGGLANYSANDVNLSDRREKTNFAPAGDYLAKICAIPVQTFNYIDQNLDEDDGLTLGVVAQDVQAVAPELVMESNWGTKDEPKMRLSIYQTDLQYALMKALQELKAEFDAYKATHP